MVSKRKGRRKRNDEGTTESSDTTSNYLYIATLVPLLCMVAVAATSGGGSDKLETLETAEHQTGFSIEGGPLPLTGKIKNYLCTDSSELCKALKNKYGHVDFKGKLPLHGTNKEAFVAHCYARGTGLFADRMKRWKALAFMAVAAVTDDCVTYESNKEKAFVQACPPLQVCKGGNCFVHCNHACKGKPHAYTQPTCTELREDTTVYLDDGTAHQDVGHLPLQMLPDDMRGRPMFKSRTYTPLSTGGADDSVVTIHQASGERPRLSVHNDLAILFDVQVDFYGTSSGKDEATPVDITKAEKTQRIYRLRGYQYLAGNPNGRPKEIEYWSLGTKTTAKVWCRATDILKKVAAAKNVRKTPEHPVAEACNHNLCTYGCCRPEGTDDDYDPMDPQKVERSGGRLPIDHAVARLAWVDSAVTPAVTPKKLVVKIWEQKDDSDPEIKCEPDEGEVNVRPDRFSAPTRKDTETILGTSVWEWGTDWFAKVCDQKLIARVGEILKDCILSVRPYDAYTLRIYAYHRQADQAAQHETLVGVVLSDQTSSKDRTKAWPVKDVVEGVKKANVDSLVGDDVVVDYDTEANQMYAAASQARGEWMTTVHRQYMLGRRALPPDYYDGSTERAHDRASVKRLLRKYKDGTTDRREAHQLMETLVGEPDAGTLRELLKDEPELADATGNDIARLRHMLSKGIGNALQDLYNNSDTGMRRRNGSASLLDALRRDGSSNNEVEQVVGDTGDTTTSGDTTGATSGDTTTTTTGDTTIKDNIALARTDEQKVTMDDLMIDTTTSAKAVLEKWEQGVVHALEAGPYNVQDGIAYLVHHQKGSTYHVALPVFRHEVDFDDEVIKTALKLKAGNKGALRGLQKDNHCDTEDKECKEENVCMCSLIDQTDLDNVTKKAAGIMVQGERYTVPPNSGVEFYAHAGTSSSVSVVLSVHRRGQILHVRLGGSDYDFTTESRAHVELYVGTDGATKKSGLFMHVSLAAEPSSDGTAAANTTKEVPLLTTDRGVEVAAVVFTEGTYTTSRPAPPEMPPLATQLKMMSRGREVPSKCARFALRNDWQSAVAFGVTTHGSHPKLYPALPTGETEELMAEPEYPYREALTAKEEKQLKTARGAIFASGVAGIILGSFAFWLRGGRTHKHKPMEHHKMRRERV